MSSVLNGYENFNGDFLKTVYAKFGEVHNAPDPDWKLGKIWGKSF